VADVKPSPVRFAAALPPLAALNCRSAVRIPAAVGVNFSPIIKDLPGGKAEPTKALGAKSAMSSPLIVKARAPVSVVVGVAVVPLDTVKLIPPGGGVWPMTVAGNVMVVGVMVSAAVCVVVRVSVCVAEIGVVVCVFV